MPSDEHRPPATKFGAHTHPAAEHRIFSQQVVEVGFMMGITTASALPYNMVILAMLATPAAAYIYDARLDVPGAHPGFFNPFALLLLFVA